MLPQQFGDYAPQAGSSYGTKLMPWQLLSLGKIILLKEKKKVVVVMRESIPRQVDKKSGVLEEERGGWSSQGGEKDKCPLFFFFPFSLSLYIP